MPYKIERRGDKHCVVKSDTGKTVKCHDRKTEALRHMAALKINVNEAGKMEESKDHSQGSAGATILIDLAFNETVRAAAGLVKAMMGNDIEETVRWLPVSHYHLTLVHSPLMSEEGLDTIVEALEGLELSENLIITGLGTFESKQTTAIVLLVEPTEMLAAVQSDIYDAIVNAGIDVGEFSDPELFKPHITLAYSSPSITLPDFPLTFKVEAGRIKVTREDYYTEAIIEKQEPAEIGNNNVAMGKGGKVPFIKSLIAQIFRQKSFVMEADGFKVDGNRWHAWYTNNWYDLEDEVFPVKGIDFFIARVKSGEVPYPQLWFSHIETMPHGKADFIGRVGNKVLAAGSFDDSFLAHRMKAYYRAAQKRGVRFRVSHGFTYEPRLKINGAYYLFKTFEISPIPEVGTLRAANPYTSWEVKTMQIPNDLRREIAAALSSDGKTVNEATLGLADNLIAGANKDMQQAQGEGRQSKSTLTPADVDSKLDTAMAGVNEKLDKLAGALEKALGAFETGVQTNVKAADQFKAIDERLKAVEAWQKQQAELAPPASRSPLTQLNPESSLAKLLADYEAKTSEKPLSLVEMATGQRSAEIDPAPLSGGQQS